VLLVAMGITASATFRTEREATLVPGQSMTVAGRTIRLKNVWGREEPQRSVIGATLDVLAKNGAVVGTIEPKMNYYKVSDQPVPTPDVHSSVRGDLYANLMAFEPSGANATVKIIVEPLIPWIWFGGLVVVIGAVIGMFYGGRRKPVAAPPRVSVPSEALTLPASELEPVEAGT
jgi:cytochrome c-type biogenesis protein CcmF